MRAVVLEAPGGPEALALGERPTPGVSDGRVVVRVRAAGVNRADVLQRLGRYPPPAGWPPDVLGIEYAGEIVAVGPGVTRWETGDRVMGLVGGGAYAEFVPTPANHVLAVPDGWRFEEAAAFPEAFLTAYDALRQARLAFGEHVLVHAIGSGVGTAVVQLARALGAEVAGTSRTGWKLDRARELGLSIGIETANGFEPPAELEGWADVICELVGGAYVTADVKCLALKGRIVLIGLLAGRSASVDLGALLRKRATIIGTVLRSRSDEEKTTLVEGFTRDVGPLVADGRVRPVLDRVFPMAAAGDAHRYVEGNHGFGAVVLAW